MIHTMIKSMADGVKYIKEAATSNEFADAIHAICTYMKLCCMHISNLYSHKYVMKFQKMQAIKQFAPILS